LSCRFNESVLMTEIAPALLDAIREQRAVLFLGAGASVDAKHPKGERIPQGDRLRDLICDKFLGGGLKHRPLTTVAAIAANEAGFAAFQKFIRDRFVEFEPADFHFLIPQFRWRAIATTNFDLIIEKAYAASRPPLQNLVTTVKDGDGLDVRLNAETNPVAYYKLHGCIDFYTDPSIPLILGNEQYASYETNRTRFYGRFRDLGFEYPIIFAGYSISDPHIQRVLFDLTDPSIGRPPYYLISPGIADAEARYWATHRVYVIDSDFESFLKKIDKALRYPIRPSWNIASVGKLEQNKWFETCPGPNWRTKWQSWQWEVLSAC
jgi:SIR2-like protein